MATDTNSTGLLAASRAVTKLPAQDLDRARGFYRDKLGLEPVAELRARGVVFEVDDVVEAPDNYPSKGTGERGNWFRDSEGNLLGLGQPTS